MKTGWLLVNHFLAGNKFTELYRFFEQAAASCGVELKIKTGTELLQSCGGDFLNLKEEPLPDFVLFWDKDIRLAQSLEAMGLRLFNNARAIFLCDDKSMTHLTLAGKIPMPQTIIAPMTYEAVGYSDVSFIKDVSDELGFPFIIKECFGSFGKQVYLVSNIEEAEKIVRELAGKPFVFQKFIRESFGRDMRLQVVGDKVVASMLRYNETGDFRANISGGASMKPFNPPQKAVDLALSAAKLLGLDFAGVDLLFGEEDEPVLCEVNSNAHFKNLFDCTGVNVADAILEHIVNSI